MKPYTIELEDLLGNKVSGLVSIPKKATSVVILSHGYSSNRNSKIYQEITDDLNREGIGAVRYDYYGHGVSYGHRGPGYGASDDVTVSKAVESLRAFVGYIRESGNFDVGLLGSSFGGLLSIIIASQDPKIKTLALKSSVTEPKRFWMRRITTNFGEDGLTKWERDGIIRYKEGVEDYNLTWDFWRDLQRYDILRDAEKISCPTLIVHGGNDTCVPITQSYELAMVLGTDVKVVIGTDHSYSEPMQYSEVKKLLTEFLFDTL